MNHVDTRDLGAISGAIARAASFGREEEFAGMLNRIPFAVYRTDRAGTITHYNAACVELAGREPAVHQDRWCVTWKLFTREGTFLPHDECPMAVAIRENRAVRGVRAVAERPDGRRVHFAPYPTPFHDDAGELIGGVNLLVDISDPQHQAHCRSVAEKCRRLARSVGDDQSRNALTKLASEYDELSAMDPGEG